MSEAGAFDLTIPPGLAGKRLDQALAQLLPEASRAQIQQWIRAGAVRVDERAAVQQRAKVRGGERVHIDAPARAEEKFEPQALPLDIVYEDPDLLVIDKPPGLVVHPGAGNRSGTLLNALLHHAPELARVARAGIVHRLDKDTSGLLVVARSEPVRLALTRALKRRSIEREYLALVQGRVIAGGTVDAPIGRHPRLRTRMAVVQGGRPAVTHYRVERRFAAHTLLRVRLESGRTHQIRVHLAHLRHPVVGDPEYGGRALLPAGAEARLREALRAFRRQALHATRLSLRHPASGAACVWEAPPPQDMQRLLALLDKPESYQYEGARG